MLRGNSLHFVPRSLFWFMICIRRALKSCHVFSNMCAARCKCVALCVCNSQTGLLDVNKKAESHVAISCEPDVIHQISFKNNMLYSRFFFLLVVYAVFPKVSKLE